jgi:Holliday junction resolvase
MTSKSKSKGNTAERQICEDLERILGGKFIRVPNSGAFIGGANYMRAQKMDEAQVKTFRGDIICPSNMPKLIIESKFYQDFPFHMLVANKKIVLLDSWLKQNLDICQPGDFPVLIMRFNRKGSFCVVRKDDIEGWDLHNFSVYHYMTTNQSTETVDDDVFIITEFESFFTQNKSRILTRAS